MAGLSEVEFHTGVADPVAYACRLLRKAVRRGARVLVTAPGPTLAALDRGLWTFEEREFLPHVRVPGASAAVAARTPIWLAAAAAAALPAGAEAPRVVVNVGAEIDAASAQATAERLIEIVGAEPDEVAAGRERWRAYKAAGLAITHHPQASGHE